MKRLLLVLLPMSLFVFSCEEEQSEDTTPPTVSISSHISGQSVNEIVTITVTTQDNEGIIKVEFFIDESSVLTDTESPYEYDWNTTQYEDNYEYIVKVISYDNSDNSTESQPILLTVDNRVYLWGGYYSNDNTTELDLSNRGLTGSIPSEIGNLTNLTYLDLNRNDLTGSIPSEIGNLTNLTYLDLNRNDLTGSIPSEIGNLTNLRNLDLSLNQLTGEIPSEIGNLTNLSWLILNNNQLTGEIPESICNLVDNTYIRISNNQLCPPYPSCIEDYVGIQDTSNCGN